MNQNSKFLIVFYFLITYNLRAFNCDLTQNNDRFRNAVSILSINSNSSFYLKVLQLIIDLRFYCLSKKVTKKL